MDDAIRVPATRHVLAVNDLAESTTRFVDVLGFTPDGHRVVVTGEIT